MDFDPDGAKWQCCCCNLTSGLKILAAVEIFFSFIFIIIGGADLINSVRSADSEQQDYFFGVGLIAVALMMAMASALLIYGISKSKEKFMYPTLVARVLLIMFVTVFGVKEVVVDPEEEAKKPSPEPRRINGRLIAAQDDPPMVLRLVFLVFLMIFVSIGVLYTIYLVVRCIRYVHAYARLKSRRESLIIAAQIDPELLAGRRLSQASNI